MRARGKNYERMNKKQKTKIDKTVKRMKKIRIDDNIKLRKNIQDKLEWAIEQKKKGLEAIENWRKSIQKNTQELFKLEGIILCLTQILSETSKKEK